MGGVFAKRNMCKRVNVMLTFRRVLSRVFTSKISEQIKNIAGYVATSGVYISLFIFMLIISSRLK